MKRCDALHINFAPRSTASLVAGTPLWAWMLAIAGLVLMCWAGISALGIADQKQSWQTTLERKTRALHADAQRQKQVRSVSIPEAQAVAINAAIQQLNLPWSDLFDAVEAATPDNIALISIEPDAKKQTLRGEAEALSSDAMIAYIEQLKKQALFVDVILTKHEINQQDPFRPIRFQFEAQWKDAGK